MKLSKRLLLLLPFFVLIALFISSDGIREIVPSLQEQEEQLHKTAYFMIGSPEYLGPDGAHLTADSAPVLDGTTGYIPVSTVAEVFGMDPEDLKVHAVSLSGSDYLRITECAQWSSLTLARSGAVFALTDGGYLPEFSEFSQSAGSFEYLPMYGTQTYDSAFKPEYYVNPYVTYTYDQMLIDIDELTQAYPGLISSWQFGTTVEGRQLMAVSLGFGEREVLINASIHGSEYFSTPFVMNLIDKYAYGYAADDRFEDWSYRELLDGTRFIFSVMLNPDGVNICQGGLAASSNYENLRHMNMQQTGHWGWKANSNGVDLNRNFPFNWWNSNYVYEPGAKYYFGPAEASEPETRAMMALLESTPFYTFIDFHLYGENIDWIDSETLDHRDEYSTLAYTLMRAFRYYDRGVEKVDVFGGYLVNYARNIYDTQSLLIELSSIWKPPAFLFDSQTKKVYPVLFYVGDSVAEMENNGLGYRVTYNGEDVMFTGERTRKRGLCADQLTAVMQAAGYNPQWNDAILKIWGTPAYAAAVMPFEEVSGIPVYLENGEKPAADLNELMFTFGISVRISDSGGTLIMESFN